MWLVEVNFKFNLILIERDPHGYQVGQHSWSWSALISQTQQCPNEPCTCVVTPLPTPHRTSLQFLGVDRMDKMWVSSFSAFSPSCSLSPLQRRACMEECSSAALELNDDHGPLECPQSPTPSASLVSLLRRGNRWPQLSPAGPEHIVTPS